MKTELIASWRLQPTKNGEMYVVTTVTGATIWCTKQQFDTNSEQITYNALKAGDTVIATRNSSRNTAEGEPEYLKGDKIVLKQDRNELVGCCKQIIKKYDAKEMIDYLVQKGVTPQFSLS